MYASRVKDVPPEWRKYVAIGDSFTEGVGDRGLGSSYYGWADRLAQSLADMYCTSLAPLEYANLAVRGRLLSEMMEEQVPRAMELRPDLVTLSGGMNDVMRRSFDLNRKATELEKGVRTLKNAGIDVLLVGYGDPSESMGLMRLVAERVAGFNSAVTAIAEAYDCYLLNFWEIKSLNQSAVWDEDRLHLNPLGHALTAQLAMQKLGWRQPDDSVEIVQTKTPGSVSRVVGHARWAKNHGAPWLGRRLSGRSSGDGIEPKYWSYVDVFPRLR